MPKIKNTPATVNNGMENQEDWETLTLKKKSSAELDKYIGKCKRYLEMIAACR